MEFRVLGPVQLWAGGSQVNLGPGKQRCVLAVLLIGAGRPQQVELLIDRVWGEAPPAQVRTALYSYISRLRGIFRELHRVEGGAEIVLSRRAGSYLLDIPADSLDLHRFETASRGARAARDTAERVALLREALGLWHGSPLQDVNGTWADEVRRSLQRQRVRACAECAQHLIELGRYIEAGELLEQELEHNPLAESLAGQLMVSLQFQGRNAEALHCYAVMRRRLGEELGVEPGPALQELHVQILRGEGPSLPVLGTERSPSWREAASEAPEAARTEYAAGRPSAPADVLGQPPYRGLQTFQPEHAALFFGRQDLVDELLARLTFQRFLAVFGPSGSGKSSLLRAGLIPAIHAIEVPGSAGWTTVLCTPGEHPLRELATGLASAVGTPAAVLARHLTADPACLGPLLREDSGRQSTILLMIDQFEEIFTLCTDPHERAQFVEALLSLVDNRSVSARVAIGVRADFYASCAQFPALVALLRDQQLLVGPMSEDELRSVITGPAAGAELTVEPALIDAVLADVLGEPAALPMLSHALLETWRRREGNLLAVHHYYQTGGVRGAIAQTADHVYAGFDPTQRALAREIFLRLTAPGEGPEDTRRRASRDELLDRPDADDVRAVLARLAKARLVTLDEHTVTVVHEFLIRGWPTLRDWINEDRERLRAHRRLTDTAREWDALARDESLLYRGSLLAVWKDRDVGQLNDLERDFLASSRRQAASELAVRQRRVRITLTGAGVALVALLTLAIVAFGQAGEARRQRDQALADRLVTSARSQLSLDPELSVLLARQAIQIEPTAQAVSALAQALSESRIRVTWPTAQGQSMGVDFSPDGQWIASAGHDHTVRIGSVRGNHEPIVLRGHEDRVLDVAFSPDGRRVASASEDGTVRIWQAAGGGTPIVLKGPNMLVHAVVWRPDGTEVATGSDDGTVRIWQADGSGTPTVLSGHTKRALGVAFSPDGTRLASASADTTIRIWDLAGRKTATVLRGHTDTVEDLAFGPDGRRVVSGSTDGTMRVWKIDGTGPPVVMSDHQGTVETVAFSHDGLSVLSGGNDRTAWVRRADGRGDPVVLRGNGGPVWGVAFSPGDHLVATADDAGTVRLWDPRARPELRTFPGSNGPVWSTSWSPDGTRVAGACDDGTVRVQSIDGGDPILLTGHVGPVQGVAFSPDGRLVASAGSDGTVRIWRAGGDQHPTVLTGHAGIVWGVAFTPDGRHVLSGGTDGSVRMWPTSGHDDPVVLHTGASAVRGVAVSPDGTRIASANRDGTVHVWRLDAPDHPLVLSTGHEGLVWSVAFSHDSDQVTAVSNDGTARVWKVSGSPTPTVLTGHDGVAWSIASSPDSDWLASTGNDHTVRMWLPGTTRDPIVFTGPSATFEGVSFGPDNRLAVGRDDGTVQVWQCEECVSIDRLRELANQRTTRDFTAAERETYQIGAR